MFHRRKKSYRFRISQGRGNHDTKILVKPIIGYTLLQTTAALQLRVDSMLTCCTLFLVFTERCCIYSITFSKHAHYGRSKVLKVLPLRRRETTSQRSACDLSCWPPQGPYTPQCHKTSTLFCPDLPILYWAQSLEKAQQHICHTCITEVNQGCRTLLLESLSCRVYH